MFSKFLNYVHNRYVIFQLFKTLWIAFCNFVLLLNHWIFVVIWCIIILIIFETHQKVLIKPKLHWIWQTNYPVFAYFLLKHYVNVDWFKVLILFWLFRFFVGSTFVLWCNCVKILYLLLSSSIFLRWWNGLLLNFSKNIISTSAKIKSFH